jgi:tetratricopeptide (TPR) repeat protein
LNALLIVATTIPQNLPTDAPGMEKALTKAMEYAKKLTTMTRLQQLNEATWQTAVQAPAHGVIGFVLLQKAQYEDAEKEFEQTVKITPKDQLAWYRYGLAATKITIAAQGLIKPAYDKVNANTTLGPDRDAAVAERDAIEKDFEAKRDKAIEILVSAVALPDTNIKNAARVTLESLYNPKHDNTNAGLDELIEKRKAELK